MNERFYQRGNTWYVDYQESGKRVRRSLQTETYETAIINWHNIKNAMEPKLRVLSKDALWRLSKPVFTSARKNAKRRGISYDLSDAETEFIVYRTHGLCELSGIPFSPEGFTDYSRRPWMPSLDRIDNSRGYCAGNTRLICVAANIALNEWGDDVLYRLIDGINRHTCVTKRGTP